MIAADAVSQLEAHGFGSVRRARPDDGAAVARLLVGTGIGSIESGHALVLDVDGLVVAAMHVVCDGSRAHVRFLVVDEAIRGMSRSIEERMLGVATALCEAYGCRDLDICATARNDIAVARQARALRGRS
jgi:hypothetical protein